MKICRKTFKRFKNKQQHGFQLWIDKIRFEFSISIIIFCILFRFSADAVDWCLQKQKGKNVFFNLSFSHSLVEVGKENIKKPVIWLKLTPKQELQFYWR